MQTRGLAAEDSVEAARWLSLKGLYNSIKTAPDFSDFGI